MSLIFEWGLREQTILYMFVIKITVQNLLAAEFRVTLSQHISRSKSEFIFNNIIMNIKIWLIIVN